MGLWLHKQAFGGIFKCDFLTNDTHVTMLLDPGQPSIKVADFESVEGHCSSEGGNETCGERDLVPDGMRGRPPGGVQHFAHNSHDFLNSPPANPAMISYQWNHIQTE